MSFFRRLFRLVPLAAAAVASTATAAPDETEGPVTTSSGLQYEVITEGGDGPRPKLGDSVTVHYTGTLLDGTEFDSSRRSGKPAKFTLGGVIPGWNEGLQLMTPGARYKFTIPSDLAYGPRGMPPTIGPNKDLVFDVELISVTPGPAPDWVPSKEERRQETESGLVYEVLEEGAGDPPSLTDFFELHYTMWNEDGRMLESSRLGQQPLKVNRERMQLEFLKEAPGLMKPGSKVRFEVPAKLTFGDEAKPGIPAGTKTTWLLEMGEVSRPLPMPDFVLPPVEERTTTDSGLQYKMLEEGEGTAPKMGEEVKVHYAGWLLDGKSFDSSFSRGEPSSFALGRVIQGWNEGLQLMKPGGKAIFVIPGDLAYGPAGRPPQIGPNETLVFFVELLEVAK